MSRDGPPSPIQPPVVTSSAGRLAQLQHPPNFPITNFGQQTSHHPPGITLAPIQSGAEQDPPTFDRLKLPPIQQPPWRAPPLRGSSGALPISNLLSRDPETPRDREAQHGPLPYSRVPGNVYQPSVSRSSHSRTDVPSHLPTQPPHSTPLPNYIDQSPITYRPSAPRFSSQWNSQPQWRHPSSSFETEPVQRSPSSSTHSFNREYYSTSSEPSPRTPAGSIHPLPAQLLVSQPPSLTYNLSIRQQPAAARACGYGERDRRVIDPPPILELKITDRSSGAPEQDPNALLALHCGLLSHDGKEDVTEVPPAQDDIPSTRRLMGTLVASPYQAKDEHGIAGTFFVFPDMSCRSPGQYRLRFKLLRVDPTRMMAGAIHPTVASTVSGTFSVYTAKDFPGMRASSALLKSLRRQGLNVGVKKGSEARKGKGKAKKDSSDDDDDDDDDDDSSDGDVTSDRRNSNGSGEVESRKVIGPKSKEKTKGKRRKRDA